jgi:hypothetical protein
MNTKKLPQPSEPASIAPIVEHHERKIAEARAAKKSVDPQAAAYTPSRDRFDDKGGETQMGTFTELLDLLRTAGGEIQMGTLTELLDLLRTKTDYRFHVAVEILPADSAFMKTTINNERDAKETIRRLKAKP